MGLFDNLTDRQQRVYEFIRDKIRNRGYGPTVREIASEFDIQSPNGVVCHLKALEKKGLITRERKWPIDRPDSLRPPLQKKGGLASRCFTFTIIRLKNRSQPTFRTTPTTTPRTRASFT